MENTKKRRKDSEPRNLEIHKQLESNYKHFINLKKRETDLSEAPIFNEPPRPQDQAIEFSLKNGLKPVFAIDIFGPNKSYCVCSYGKMKNILLKRRAHHKNHFYEVTFPIPSKLFVDVDIDLNFNKINDFDKTQSEFFEFTKEFFLENKLIRKKDDLDITILDSSHNQKISRHFVFRIRNNEKKYFRNPYHCGSFIRQLQNFIFLKEGIDDPSKSKFWFKLKKENAWGDKGHFICDLAIYSTYRVFRTVLSEKLPDPKKEKPTPILLPKDKPLNDDFSEYFVQSGVSVNEKEIIDFPEIDGSEPKSTNNVTVFRIDKINKKMVVLSSEMSKFYRNNFPFEKVWSLFGDENRQFRFEFFNFKAPSGVVHSKLTKFDDGASFQKYIKNKVPACIHISSIADPSTKEERRELVIDVDKTDYPFLNCCGKDDKLCSKCFSVIKLALLISKYYFKYVLAYTNVRFFFSGKKGFHCWIFDKEVTSLSSEQHRKICGPLLKYDEKTMNYFINYIKSLYVIRSTLEELKKKFVVPSDTSPLEYFWIRIDELASFSVSHSVKCPWAIHKSSRIQSFEINDVDAFCFYNIK